MSIDDEDRGTAFLTLKITKAEERIAELEGALKALRPYAEEQVADICADIQEGGTSGPALKMWNDVIALGTTRPTLAEIKEFVPLGFECRSCGASVYNHLQHAARYIEKGEACCPNMRHWIEQALATKPQEAEAHEFNTIGAFGECGTCGQAQGHPIHNGRPLNSPRAKWETPQPQEAEAECPHGCEYGTIYHRPKGDGLSQGWYAKPCPIHGKRETKP